MPTRLCALTAVALLAVGAAAPALAHHGRSGYDANAALTLTGTIKESGYEHPAFRLKLVLVAAGATNAFVFHRWPFRSVARWDLEAPAPPAARAVALASLALWTGVIACGRLLAYFSPSS